MHLAQQKVDIFVTKHSIRAGAVTRVLDTLSELGEVAKEIVTLTDYGKRPLPPAASAELREEMGDLLFVMLCLANELDVDLETTLDEALAKYEARFARSGRLDSKSQQGG